jgi:hypothetical protein
LTRVCCQYIPALQLLSKLRPALRVADWLLQRQSGSASAPTALSVVVTDARDMSTKASSTAKASCALFTVSPAELVAMGAALDAADEEERLATLSLSSEELHGLVPNLLKKARCAAWRQRSAAARAKALAAAHRAAHSRRSPASWQRVCLGTRPSSECARWLW